MMQNTRFPKVTLLLLTYNGGEGVRKCLESVRKQDYPQGLIDIVVVDDASTDKSVEIAKDFGARVFVSGKRDMYLSWAIGLHKARGEFIYLIEQDIELRSKDFIKKMMLPLIEDPKLAGSITRSYPNKSQSWVTRFISYNPAQCDPLYEYLTPSIEKSFIEKKDDYFICKFSLGKIYPDARVFYRLEFLKKTPIWRMKRCFDHDLEVKMVRAGYDKYAYVPGAGIYHNHAKSLKQLLNKRVRNLTSHYFPYQDSLEYRWIDVNNIKDIFKMGIWIVYANLFLPATIRGFIRFLKYKDWALLMEPIITITTTDIILFTFFRNKGGRNIIQNSLNTLFFKRNIVSKGAFGK
jgi:glycosyltransferase involved in cell wall biosynthesis